MSRRRSDVDEMPETPLAKDRQRCGNALHNTFDVDVDHFLPIIDAQVVETGNRHHVDVVDENIKLALPLLTGLDRWSRRFTSVRA